MAPPVTVMDPADRLSRLPEEIRAHILSLLPAQEAVRTCVLARTWRDVWKFTGRLLITAGDKGNSVRKFVDSLLRFRLNELQHASLDECEITFHMYGGDDGYATQSTVVHGWIRRSLECQVRVLRVEEEGLKAHLLVSDMRRLVVSRHLTRLELNGVRFECADLNLDGCPALEHLEIGDCCFTGVRKIMSPSLQHLVITRCQSDADPRRIKVSAPCLVSLWLKVGRFKTPVLESMPELVEAYVSIDRYWADDCYCVDPMGCYHVMRAAHISDGNVDSDIENDAADYTGCVLLEGLAQAKHLVLLAHQAMYVFRRDLRMCPTFSNMKTLVLNGYWCEPADCRPLACILQHAPVLENLTVIFSQELELKYGIVMEGRPDATAKSTMTNQCLKIVKVKCHTVDEGVQNVLKFLITFNICFVTQSST